MKKIAILLITILMSLPIFAQEGEIITILFGMMQFELPEGWTHTTDELYGDQVVSPDGQLVLVVSDVVDSFFELPPPIHPSTEAYFVYAESEGIMRVLDSYDVNGTTVFYANAEIPPGGQVFVFEHFSQPTMGFWAMPNTTNTVAEDIKRHRDDIDFMIASVLGQPSIQDAIAEITVSFEEESTFVSADGAMQFTLPDGWQYIDEEIDPESDFAFILGVPPTPEQAKTQLEETGFSSAVFMSSDMSLEEIQNISLPADEVLVWVVYGPNLFGAFDPPITNLEDITIFLEDNEDTEFIDFLTFNGREVIEGRTPLLVEPAPLYAFCAPEIGVSAIFIISTVGGESAARAYAPAVEGIFETMILRDDVLDEDGELLEAAFCE